MAEPNGPNAVSLGVSGRVRKILASESPKLCLRTDGNLIGIRSLQSRAITHRKDDDEEIDFFEFNKGVFGEEDGNESVFAKLCRPLCDNLLDGNGFNSMLMAYGTTGSGKTYTLLGDGGESMDRGVLQMMIGYLKSSAKCKQLTMSGV